MNQSILITLTAGPETIRSQLASPNHTAHLSGLVLGCIRADFSALITKYGHFKFATFLNFPISTSLANFAPLHAFFHFGFQLLHSSKREICRIVYHFRSFYVKFPDREQIFGIVSFPAVTLSQCFYALVTDRFLRDSTSSWEGISACCVATC